MKPKKEAGRAPARVPEADRAYLFYPASRYPKKKPDPTSGGGPTIAKRLYASSEEGRLENDGKKREPHTVALPAAAASNWGHAGISAWASPDLFERWGLHEIMPHQLPPASVEGYASAFASLSKLQLDEAGQSELMAVKQGFMKAQITASAASAVVKMSLFAMRNGRYPGTPEEAVKQLSEECGSRQQAIAVIEDAKKTVAQIAEKWPQVRSFLNDSGLGNHPAVIRMLIDHAKQQKAKAS